MQRCPFALCASLAALIGISLEARAAVVYDGIQGVATASATGSTPRTYVGQPFNIQDPGGGAPVAITQLVIRGFVSGAQSFTETRMRVQFWDTFDPGATGTALIFSNPNAAGIQTQLTGPITTTGSASRTFTFDFSSSPIILNSLTNLGISANWQSFDGSGFVDNTNLTIGLRNASFPAMTVGTNLAPSNGFFRNASGLTDFNFQADDARTLTGVTTGGIVFSLTGETIPEPASVAVFGLGIALLGRRRRNS